MAAGFIAVIEVGSEKIHGIAGVKNTNGGIEVKAAVSADASSFVERGVIYNLNQASECFTAIIRELEKALHARVEKVYTGVDGQSLHSVHNSIIRTLTSQTVISKEIVESIMEQNTESFHNEDCELLCTVPQEYKVGGFEKLDPVGIIDSRIEGNFLNILARKELKKNLRESFRQANIQCADIFITPLLLSNTILTDNEKKLGCALVAFQYDTITVSVYQRNILRHLAVLPLGEKNVVLDIVNSFNVEENEAKNLLRKYGSAYYEDSEFNDKSKNVIACSDGTAIDRKEFYETVEARLQEIIANIWQQLTVSGVEENRLRSGVVFTGSACGIKNVPLAFQQYKKSSIKVRIQKSLSLSVTDLSHKLDDNCNAALSILVAGKENCSGGSLESGIFSAGEMEAQQSEQKKINPEEEKKRLEEERLEKEFQLACDEVRSLIEDDSFKEAQKKVEELKRTYPEKLEQITPIQTALLIRKKERNPGIFSKLGSKFNRMKKQGEDFLKNMTKED